MPNRLWFWSCKRGAGSKNNLHRTNWTHFNAWTPLSCNFKPEKIRFHRMLLEEPRVPYQGIVVGKWGLQSNKWQRVAGGWDNYLQKTDSEEGQSVRPKIVSSSQWSNGTLASFESALTTHRLVLNLKFYGSFVGNLVLYRSIFQLVHTTFMKSFYL